MKKLAFLVGRIFAFLLTLWCFSVTAYHESYNHRVFEEDQNIDQWQNDGWKKRERVHKDKTMELSFALKQENLDQLEKLLWEVSDPDSPKYGQYLTSAQITDIVAPLPDSIARVEHWLRTHGVTGCRLVANRDYLNCKMTCEQAERLLKGTTFFYFEHHNVTRVIRSISRYHIREDVSHLLDLVVGIHRFPLVKNKRKMTGKKRDDRSSQNEISIKHKLDFEAFAKRNVELQEAKGYSTRRQKHEGINPKILRQRYNLTDKHVGSHPNNSQSSVQFLEEYISSDDLKQFMDTFVGDSFAHRTAWDKLIGPNPNESEIEAVLDTEYIMSMGANISTWLWNTPGRHETEEPFLQWLQDLASTENAPLVHTVSYGDKEPGLSVPYMKRVNIEFIKTGLRGMSIFFASGDTGADCKNGTYQPEFPTSSPYVTSVGGTGFTIPNKMSGEHAQDFSGGGFSNVFSQPAYQQKAVENYLASPSAPPKDLYNTTGRAYPDVAALCINYSIVIRGTIFSGANGTSASTPTFAGIISMVNEHRLQANKPPMGFLNPFIYKHPNIFYDVTTGCNFASKKPYKNGFCAVPGFDPVTGFGTPNFPEIVKAAMAVVGK